MTAKPCCLSCLDENEQGCENPNCMCHAPWGQPSSTPRSEPRHDDTHTAVMHCLDCEMDAIKSSPPAIVCLDGDVFYTVEAMRDHIELVHVGIDIPEYGASTEPERP